MPIVIDVSTYEGDPIEEWFKPVSSYYLSYWWFFREVIRAGTFLEKDDESQPTQEEKDSILALAYLNYSVYTNYTYVAVDAGEIEALEKVPYSSYSITLARRNIKAAVGSMYSAMISLANATNVLFTMGNGKQENLSLGEIEQNANTSSNSDFKKCLKLLKEMSSRLVIRHHEDHYWVSPIRIEVISGIGARYFVNTAVFRGVLPHESQPQDFILARKFFEKEVEFAMIRANTIYEILVQQFPNYLTAKNWRIPYPGGSSPIPQILTVPEAQQNPLTDFIDGVVTVSF